MIDNGKETLVTTFSSTYFLSAESLGKLLHTFTFLLHHQSQTQGLWLAEGTVWDFIAGKEKPPNSKLFSDD